MGKKWLLHNSAVSVLPIILLVGPSIAQQQNITADLERNNLPDGSLIAFTNKSAVVFAPDNLPGGKLHPTIKDYIVPTVWLWYNFTLLVETQRLVNQSNGKSYFQDIPSTEYDLRHNITWNRTITTSVFGEEQNKVPFITFHTTLDNGAFVELGVLVLSNTTTYQYGDYTLVSSNTIKFNVNITGWPFISTNNFLRIINNMQFHSTPSEASVGTPNLNAPFSDFLILTDRMNCSLHLASYTVSDGHMMPLKSSRNVTSDTIRVYSYFLPAFNTTFYDPNFEVLLNTAPTCQNGCSNNGVCIDDDECRCNKGWSGDDCSILAPTPSPSPSATKKPAPTPFIIPTAAATSPPPSTASPTTPSQPTRPSSTGSPTTSPTTPPPSNNPTQTPTQASAMNISTSAPTQTPTTSYPTPTPTHASTDAPISDSSNVDNTLSTSQEQQQQQKLKKVTAAVVVSVVGTAVIIAVVYSLKKGHFSRMWRKRLYSSTRANTA
eukprot:TRINITY_DN5782_c0_g1_i1.p1 TRINITY_DN5782_c0_g1~~TRINITY_DN5782_c0_g1_i1.p1  ORF type:complete len:491 (+),score=70.34 TRINITY_DN5782_c0_g1_i1:1-1473(+)